MKKSFIKVNWQFEGFHRYENAPEEVSFLRNIHRHIFKCTAKIEVTHDNRELEFFLIQRELKRNFNDSSQDGKSCEMIATEILEFLKTLIYQRTIEIEVSEDGENSAIVEYIP